MFKSIECRTTFGLQTVMNTTESGLQVLAAGHPMTLEKHLCAYPTFLEHCTSFGNIQ